MGIREPHEVKKKYFDLGGNRTHDLQSCPIHPHCNDPLKANSVRSIRTGIVKSPCGPFSSSDPYGSLRALAIRRAEFTDGMLHLIRETWKNSHLPARGMCVNGSFDSQFVHLIKSTVNIFGVQSSAICNSCLKRT